MYYAILYSTKEIKTKLLKKIINIPIFDARICKNWIDQLRAYSLPWHEPHLTRQAFPMELWGHSQDTSARK